MRIVIWSNVLLCIRLGAVESQAIVYWE